MRALPTAPGRLAPSTVQTPQICRRRLALAVAGPALFEAALNACKHPYYAQRYRHTKRRLGRQRGPKVAQIDLARRLTEAIWHMLTRNQPFAPVGAPFRLAA